MLGIQLVNQSIIGPMFSCPINNNLTYTSPASLNGNGDGTQDNGFRTPQLSNVPYLYSFCFENVKSRSLVLINTDLNNSHTVTFSGNNAPTGTVTKRQYAPSGLDLLNEAPNGTNDQNSPMRVNLTTSTLSSPTSITLPPYSVTALDYTAASAPYASAPAFSPAPGTYTVPTPVTITSTPGATIYYSTSGSTPTTSSSVYSGPITVGANETLTAMATDTGYNNSSVASASYIIAPVLPTPTFSVAAGTYTTPQQVSIADAASGVTIYYTTNGTTPTSSSTVYNGPITVGVNQTLEAMVVEPGFTNSSVASISYIIAPVLPAPTFSPAGGSYSTAQTVTLSDSAPGTTIYYTVNGSTPTSLSTPYTAPITVNVTETLQALAVATGFTNSPVSSATYSISGSTQYIGILAGGFSASSFYLNGGASVPSNGTLEITDGGQGEMRSAWYKTEVPIQNFVTDFTFQQTNASSNGMTFTIQSMGATADGGNGSGMGYVGIKPSVAIKFDLNNSGGEGVDSTGMYTNGALPTVPSIDLSTTGINLHSGDIMDAHMVYNGTNLTMTLTDTVTSAAVTEVFPVNIPSIVGGNTAWVGFTGGTGGKSATQSVLSWTYVKSAAASTTAATVATPAFSLAAGTFTASQSVAISDSTSGATIYYTTNGTTPTTSSTKYSGAITVSASETLEAIAVATGDTNSAVASATYTISTLLPAPTFSVAAGTFTTSQSVAISDATAGTTIYYTTNGTTPTTASAVYSGAIPVSASETIEAIAVETSYTNSPVASAAYSINPLLPAPAFSLAPATFTTAQSVAISDATAAATIYYTTNGTTPTAASTKYSGAITVSATETLEAVAVENGYTTSPAASATFTIAPILPAPSFNLAAGTYNAAQAVIVSDATAGATIYYTTNGTAPTSASSLYSGAITVSSSETIEAIAVENGYTTSPIATAGYIINAADPVYISYPSGGFTASSLDLNGGATVTSGGLLQLTDGGSGEARSAWFGTAVPVQNFVTDFTFEQLNATADGMTFTIQGQGPAALGSNGGSLGYQNITNSIAIKFDLYNNAGEGTDSTGIFTNGAMPTLPAINLSSTPINLHSGDIMDAHLVYNGTNLTMTLTDTVTKGTVTEVFPVNIPSIVGGDTAYVGFTAGTGGHSATQNVLTWTYSSTPENTAGMTSASPKFSPAPGTYASAQTVTITDPTKGAVIYYTTNGTTPTSSSNQYSAAIKVSATEILEAVAVTPDQPNGPVAKGVYTIGAVVPAPTFSVAGGTYPASEKVSISDSIAGATICFTTDGTTPTASSTKYTGAITLSASETLKAIAMETGYKNSSVTSAAYVIATPLAAPIFSRGNGTYSTSQSVTISDVTADAVIYYTTNGTKPTTASTKYTGAITVSETERLQAIAIATGHSASPVASAAYTIAAPLAAPKFSHTTGSYSTSQSVTISEATAGATIYYTTNGTKPTSASIKYTAAITVSSTEKLEAIAVKTGRPTSPVSMAALTIDKTEAASAGK
jgi:hypothetical protein